MSTTENGKSSPASSTKVSSVKDYSHHVNDLTKTPLKKTSVKIVPVLDYAAYMGITLKNLLCTLIFNWSMAFVHPLNFLVLITLVPLLSTALLIIGMSFRIGSALGMGNVLNAVGCKWGEGLSLVNWWNPLMFTSDVIEIVRDGIVALGQPQPIPVENSDNVDFNIDIAELLLFMSSIIYERDEKAVSEAYDKITDNPSEEDLELAMNRLKGSVSKIHDQAKLWGLEFISLSELNSLGGPFSGIFYSKEHNFIVLVFKGTTPTDFSEFIIDLMLQRVDASNFVFGEIHEGMYTSLFSRTKGRGVKMNRESPYITIVEAIRSKAADIVNSKVETETKVPVNVWVTGHSLGASLASIFFARCLKSPEDLGPNCILRDGYLFGCPAIGNGSFASLFSSYLNIPFNRSNTLWRVVNDTDIVAHLAGIEDTTMSQTLTNHCLLDYTHVGEEIRFFKSGARPECTREVLPSIDEQIFVENDDKAVADDLAYDNPPKKLESVLHNEPFEQPSKYVKSLWKEVNDDPLKYVEMLVPTFCRNHIPAEYFKAMQNSRRYFGKNISTS